MIHLRGWAGDPDADTPTFLLAYLDGQRFVSFTGDAPRDDVHAVFPELGNAVGFDQDLPVLPGLHILCLDATNSGSGGSNNPSLGCWLLTVPDAVAVAADSVAESWTAVPGLTAVPLRSVEIVGDALT